MTVERQHTYTEQPGDRPVTVVGAGPAGLASAIVLARAGCTVIGEQAGFQDALASFGMRYALRSGILAARSLIEGADYTGLWRKEFLPLLRTGTSNRFIFNAIGERGWRWALRGLSRSDPATKLWRLYRPLVLTRLAYPIAYLRYRGPFHDPSCDHVECGCVWCQHGVHGAVGTAT